MSTIRWTDPRDGVEVELVGTEGCAGCRYEDTGQCPDSRKAGGPDCGPFGSWRPVATTAGAPVDVESLGLRPGVPLQRDGYRINADRTAAVAVDTTWRSDMNRCPRGVRVLLLVRDGLPVIGEYRGEDGFEAWHPMPKRATTGGQQ